jgi:parallel beta-helix repeat protein
MKTDLLVWLLVLAIMMCTLSPSIFVVDNGIATGTGNSGFSEKVTALQADQEVRFNGTAIEYFSSTGSSGWNVQVDELISGPSEIIGHTVTVALWSVAGVPSGTMDPGIEPGDRVAVYGLYMDDDYVTLSESEAYHIKKRAIANPTAHFDYAPTKISVNQKVTFDASASYDPDGEITRYDWDFGDGKKESGVAATHTYTTTGKYQAVLTVTDNDGLTNSKSEEIMVHEAENVLFLYVPDDYPTIQQAVAAAQSGDTIVVRDGTYSENVKVSKSHVTIRSENGADKTTVQAKKSDDHVFEVTADHVTITGLTLQNSNGAGIKLHSSYNTITNNNCSNNDEGIQLSGSSYNYIASNIASNNRVEGVSVEEWKDGSCNNTLINNVACHNSYAGIFIMGSPESLTSHNKLLNNTANYNGNLGIELQRSPYNMLSNNKANSNYYSGIRVYGEKKKDYQNSIDTSNTVNGKPVYYFYDIHDQTISGLDTPHLTVASGTNIIIENNKIDGGLGIHLAFVTDSTVTNNIISNTRCGITLVFSSNNKIENNRLLSNSNDGICCFESSSNNLIVNNTLSYSDISIYRNSNNNIIRNNRISNNWFRGIDLFSSNNNIIYLNNFVDNSRNVHTESSTNLWNSPSKITYTYNGNTYTSHLGNYWDDYIGSDANDDGIGDPAYNIDLDKDNYPLMEPWENYLI